MKEEADTVFYVIVTAFKAAHSNILVQEEKALVFAWRNFNATRPTYKFILEKITYIEQKG